MSSTEVRGLKIIILKEKKTKEKRKHSQWECRKFQQKLKLGRSAFFDEKSIPFHEQFPRSLKIQLPLLT
jgi:hypothetical protein